MLLDPSSQAYRNHSEHVYQNGAEPLLSMRSCEQGNRYKAKLLGELPAYSQTEIATAVANATTKQNIKEDPSALNACLAKIGELPSRSSSDRSGGGDGVNDAVPAQSVPAIMDGKLNDMTIVSVGCKKMQAKRRQERAIPNTNAVLTKTIWRQVPSAANKKSSEVGKLVDVRHYEETMLCRQGL